MRRSLGLILVLLVALPAAAAAQTTRRIVIDPGHGGSDPGGVGNSLQEKNIVLDVATRFKALLDADTADSSGGGRWIAQRTRTSDVFVSLAARASFANSQGADRFMSIHSNAFGNSQANGTETFAFAEGGQGAALRNLVQSEMITAWRLTNRGNKTANFFVLRETAMPAVLHELAFITNAGDAAKLRSATERQKAARAHLFAVQRHFGLGRHTPSLTSGDEEDEVAAEEGVGSGDEDELGELGELGEEETGELDEDEGGCAAGGSSGSSGGLALLLAAVLIGAARRPRRGR